MPSIDPGHAFNLVVLLILLLTLYRVVNSAQNNLKWWHLLSTRASDGVIYLDNDKVGQMTGLIFGTWVICWLAYTEKLEILYFAAWLLYASGMGAFSKWARAIIKDRYGTPQPHPPKPPPSTTTTTTTETTP